MKTKKKNNNIPSFHNINGANIYLYNLPNQNIHISAMITGSKFKENKENCGISHLLEHVLVNAYSKCDYIKCYNYIQTIGGKHNALTSNNFIQYYIYGLSKDQYKFIDYLINIVNFPVFKKENLENEKKAVESEILKISNNKYYKFNEEFTNQYFKNSALKYFNNFSQQLKNLHKFTINDLKEWYKKNYNNYTYFIIGDFDKNIILKYLKSNIPTYKPISLTFSPDSLLTFKNKIIYVNNEKEKLVHYIIAFPLDITFTNKYFNYITFMNNILQIILFNELRNKRHLIYGIKVYNSININSISIFIEINATIQNAKKVIEILFYILNHLKENIISEKIINGYKKTILYEINNRIMNNSINNMITLYNNQFFYKSFYPNFKLLNYYDIKNLNQNINSTLFKKMILLFFKFENVTIAYQSKIKIL